MGATVRLWLAMSALLPVLKGAAAQENGIREIRSGSDFAAAFADQQTTQLVIMERWIRITDADWNRFTLPIIVNRNVSGWLDGSLLARASLRRVRQAATTLWVPARTSYSELREAPMLSSSSLSPAFIHANNVTHIHAHIGPLCFRPQLTMTGPTPDPRGWPLLDFGTTRDKVSPRPILGHPYHSHLEAWVSYLLHCSVLPTACRVPALCKWRVFPPGLALVSPCALLTSCASCRPHRAHVHCTAGRGPMPFASSSSGPWSLQVLFGPGYALIGRWLVFGDVRSSMMVQAPGVDMLAPQPPGKVSAPGTKPQLVAAGEF